MATKPQQTPGEQPEKTEDAPDSPLLDTLGAEVKKLIAKGKERGYVTYDELNAAHFQKDALAEAEKAWAEAPNEENWLKLQTLISQLQRLGSADPETDSRRQDAGPLGGRSV